MLGTLDSKRLMRAAIRHSGGVMRKTVLHSLIDGIAGPMSIERSD